jgi:hypothetical protein
VIQAEVPEVAWVPEPVWTPWRTEKTRIPAMNAMPKNKDNKIMKEIIAYFTLIRYGLISK